MEVGESYKQLAEIKYSFEDTVKQNFLEPLQSLQNKELKEVNVCTLIYTDTLTWFLGRLFDRVDLIKPVLNVCPSVRPCLRTYIRPSVHRKFL